MKFKSFFGKQFAKYIVKSEQQWMFNPIKVQEKVFKQLILTGKKTQFGLDHNFKNIKKYNDFKQEVPVYCYETLEPYIIKIVKGNADILWPGYPLYFAKTSGTTSGEKLIPITKESIKNHIYGARNALLHYIMDSGNIHFINGKMIFLQGSPVLKREGNIPSGRLSGIVDHHVPAYLHKNKMPSSKTNSLLNWEDKIDKIVLETESENMTLISGIPPWVKMYFEKLVNIKQKSISDIFPNFSIFIHGGVNFRPYKNTFNKLIGKKIDSLELYPASEGFFAFQNSQDDDGLLLLLNSGIFYEFIRADEYFNSKKNRITIEEVDLNVNYVMLISSNAGLWAYSTEDIIKFTSLNPYKIRVLGRIKHFISAFGEHVIASEIEYSIKQACNTFNVEVEEFTVAPQVNPQKGLPHHEWYIEFKKEPENLIDFANEIDKNLQLKNSYYKDLIQGKVLTKPSVFLVKKGGFVSYMKAIGKFGGQNKVVHLSNDRLIADKLIEVLDGNN